MLSLYIRNIVFLILQPGLVVAAVPFILLRGRFQEILDQTLDLLSFIGIFIIILGLFVVLYCIYRFIIEGRGTLSPIDRTKELVVQGLYKHSRNPMYVGILLILIGEALFAKSLVLFGYMLLVFLVFHLFVIFVEEPRLMKDFKEKYRIYTKEVNRWL